MELVSRCGSFRGVDTCSHLYVRLLRIRLVLVGLFAVL
jgi:hypothetical protein